MTEVLLSKKTHDGTGKERERKKKFIGEQDRKASRLKSPGNYRYASISISCYPMPMEQESTCIIKHANGSA